MLVYKFFVLLVIFSNVKIREVSSFRCPTKSTCLSHFRVKDKINGDRKKAALVPLNRLSLSLGRNLTFGTDRVALITGASRGIGKAIAETIGVAGIRETICIARKKESCQEVVDTINRNGGSATAYEVDVKNPLAVDQLCEQILEKHKKVDILINNAGITRDSIFLKMKWQDWHDVIATNLNSAFYFTSKLLKGMVVNRFGRIINMASIVGISGNVGQANYAASKAGLIGFTRSLAKEYANRGISVNAVAPGFIKSSMTDSMTEEAKKETLAKIPAKRMGTAQEVADLVAFLSSDQAGYINGKTIPIDGGMLSGGN